MRKPDFRLSENKGADQLRRNCEADQRLCFCYTDSTIYHIVKCKISSLYRPVYFGVGRNSRQSFLASRLNYKNIWRGNTFIQISTMYISINSLSFLMAKRRLQDAEKNIKANIRNISFSPFPGYVSLVWLVRSAKYFFLISQISYRMHFVVNCSNTTSY